MSVDRDVNIILMAEDDDEDSFLIQKAIREIDRNCEIIRYSNGEQLLDGLNSMLRKRLPSIVLLDLNMPGFTGHQVLEKLQKDELTSIFPTIILSTSESPKDIQESYKKGARAFLSKPDNFEDLVKLLKTTHEFWTKAIQKFPSDEAPYIKQ